MTVAVIVPCRNEARYIGQLLDSLSAQTRPPDEVVIVDDGSTDSTPALAVEWGRRNPRLPLRVVPGPAQGPAAAVNAGIRSTSAELLIRLDGHSLPATDYVERCLMPIARGIVGGRWIVRPGAETAVGRAIAAVVSHPSGSGGAKYRRMAQRETQLRAVETVPFGAYTRALWTELGGLDESLLVNEDFDFNFRARQAGYEVLLDPSMCVEYFARPTLKALARQYGRYGFWKWRMLRKDPSALHVRQLPPALVAPWLLLTTAWAMAAPAGQTFWLVAVYPSIAILSGCAVGVTRRVNPAMAAAAVATVHVCWSVGFWAAAIRGVWRRFAPA